MKILDGFEMFPWNKNFETGISNIDAQHKRLVLLLNQLAFYLGHRAEPLELDEVFDKLSAYADYHFKSEESVWKMHLKDDPWVIKHQQIHVSFISEVMKLKGEEGTRPFDDIIEDILRFLSRWLVLHILGDDMRMAKVVFALQNGLNIEQAKEQSDKEMSGEMELLVETILHMYEEMSLRTLALMRKNKAYSTRKTIG